MTNYNQAYLFDDDIVQWRLWPMWQSPSAPPAAGYHFRNYSPVTLWRKEESVLLKIPP